MKIVVVNASPRKKGALSALVYEASRAASESGAEVEELRGEGGDGAGTWP